MHKPAALEQALEALQLNTAALPKALPPPPTEAAEPAEAAHDAPAASSNPPSHRAQLCSLQAAAEALLPILLLQPCFMQQHLIGKLLCISKDVNALTCQLCTGQVPVRLPDSCSMQAAQQFARWAARQGHLMQSLRVGSLAGFATKSRQAATIAAGLHAAARSLQLQQYHSTSEGTSTPALLAQLPSTHLTSLVLRLCGSRDQQTADALRNLQQLRQLKVAGRQALASSSPTLAALSSLSLLTSLHLKRVLPGDSIILLQQLPVSLVELHITSAEVPHQGHLQLGHLTALTTLQVEFRAHSSNLHPDDVLPANLHTLCLDSCTTVEPLLPLQRLRLVTLVNLPGQELPRLKRLAAKQLVELQLRYVEPHNGGSPIDAAAAAVWRELPHLRVLVLSGCHLTAPVVAALGQLRGLTSLTVSWCSSTAAMHKFAAALWQLSSLQSLDLESNTWQQEQLLTAEEGKAAFKALLLSIEHLGRAQQLHSLRLFVSHHDLPASDTVRYLAAATQLTRLSLGQLNWQWDTSVCQQVVKLGRMGQLRELQVAGDIRITDSSLCEIVKELQPDLTYLDLCAAIQPCKLAGEGRKTGLQVLQVLGLHAVPGGHRGPRAAGDVDASLRHRLGLEESW